MEPDNSERFPINSNHPMWKEQQPAAESVKPSPDREVCEHNKPLNYFCQECDKPHVHMDGIWSDCIVCLHRRIADQDAKIVDLQSQNVVLAQNALDRSFRIAELEDIHKQDLIKHEQLERQLKEAKQEIETDDRLLKMYQDGLREIDGCKEHGDQCVPGAVKYVQGLEQQVRELRGKYGA